MQRMKLQVRFEFKKENYVGFLREQNQPKMLDTQ